MPSNMTYFNNFKFDLPRFSGTSSDALDAHDWFEEFEVVATYANIERSRFVARARLSLQGSALTFYKTLKEDTLEDWDSFKEIFLKRFGTQAQDLMIDFMRIEHKAGQDLPSFCDTFVNLTTRLEAQGQDVDELVKVNRFIDALLEPLRTAVTVNNPQTLEATIEVAKHLDRRGIAESALLPAVFKSASDKDKTNSSYKTGKWQDNQARDNRSPYGRSNGYNGYNGHNGQNSRPYGGGRSDFQRRDNFQPRRDDGPPRGAPNQRQGFNGRQDQVQPPKVTDAAIDDLTRKLNDMHLQLTHMKNEPQMNACEFYDDYGRSREDYQNSSGDYDYYEPHDSHAFGQYVDEEMPDAYPTRRPQRRTGFTMQDVRQTQAANQNGYQQAQGRENAPGRQPPRPAARDAPFGREQNDRRAPAAGDRVIQNERPGNITSFQQPEAPRAPAPVRVQNGQPAANAPRQERAPRQIQAEVDMPPIQRRSAASSSSKTYDIGEQLKATAAKISLVELLKVAPGIRMSLQQELQELNGGNVQAHLCEQDEPTSPIETEYLMDLDHEDSILWDPEEALGNSWGDDITVYDKPAKAKRSKDKHGRREANLKKTEAAIEETSETGAQYQGEQYQMDHQLAGPNISVLRAQVTINNRKLGVIVDTGATHCMVSEEVARKLLLWKHIRPVNRKFRTANGATSRPLGILLNIPVTLGSVTLPVDLYVCKARNYTMLLGNSYLAPAGLVIDYPRCKIISRPKPNIVEYIPVDYQGMAREQQPWVQQDLTKASWDDDKVSQSDHGITDLEPVDEAASEDTYSPQDKIQAHLYEEEEEDKDNYYEDPEEEEEEEEDDEEDDETSAESGHDDSYDDYDTDYDDNYGFWGERYEDEAIEEMEREEAYDYDNLTWVEQNNRLAVAATAAQPILEQYTMTAEEELLDTSIIGMREDTSSQAEKDYLRWHKEIRPRIRQEITPAVQSGCPFQEEETFLAEYGTWPLQERKKFPWLFNSLNEQPWGDHDTQFAPEIFQFYEELYGPHDVDACTNMEGDNALLDNYWTLKDDCFSKSWANLNIWCHPPLNRIEAAITHYQMYVDECCLTLLVPMWEWAPWFPTLLQWFDIVGMHESGENFFRKQPGARLTGCRQRYLVCRGKSSANIPVWPAPREKSVDLQESDDEEQTIQTIQIGREDTDNLTEEQKDILSKQVEKYEDIVAWKETDVTRTCISAPPIDTGIHTPIKQRPYKLSITEEEIVQGEVDKWLKLGIVEKSKSPWSSPMVLVPKKAINPEDLNEKKKYRLCIDFRKVNLITKTDSYPLPNTQDALDSLGQCSYFSIMDLRSAFLQVPLLPDDREKTAFSIRSGLYQFTTLPFGLKNSPSVFQRLMGQVLQGLGEFCMAYLDDIIVFSKTFEEHVEDIKQVFQRLREYELKIHPERTTLATNSLIYLGHLCSDRGIQPDPAKLKAIRAMKPPRHTRDVRSFLGLVGYYRRFIHHFSNIARPLNKLLHKDFQWTWGFDQEAAFGKLKECLQRSPILIRPDHNREFILQTDWSRFAVGAILAQRLTDRREHVVAYWSRTLTSAEVNYSASEGETLAVVAAIAHFRQYLHGRKFQLQTDHVALKWIMTSANLSGKLARWAMQLQGYDFEIVYRKGSANSNADALSRLPRVEEEEDSLEAEDGSNETFADVIDPRDGALIIANQEDCSYHADYEKDIVEFYTMEDLDNVTYDYNQRTLSPQQTSRKRPRDEGFSEGGTQKMKKRLQEACKISEKDTGNTNLRDSTTLGNYTGELLENAGGVPNQLGRREEDLLTPRRTRGRSTSHDITNDDLRLTKDVIISGQQAKANINSDRGLTLVNDICCEVCGEAEPEQTIILCESCGSGYHISCLDPPEEKIPKGAYFCEDCKAGQPKGATSIKDITEDYTTLHYIKCGDYAVEASKVEKNRIRQRASRFKWINDKLYFKETNKFGEREVPSIEDRQRIVKSLHGFGHYGVQRTANLVQERYYWSGIYGDVEKCLTACLDCQLRDMKYGEAPVLKSIPINDKAFDRVGIDLVGPTTITPRGNRYLVVAVDYLTKYAEVRAIPDKTASTIAAFFELDIIARHGCPRIVLSDNGTEFKGAFNNLLEEYGVDHKYTGIASPQTNGLTEQHNGTIVRSLNKMIHDDHTSWDLKLPKVLLGYRASLHHSTKVSPFFLVYARHPLLPITLDKKLKESGPQEEVLYLNEVGSAALERHDQRKELISRTVMANIEKAQAKQQKDYANKMTKKRKTIDSIDFSRLREGNFVVLKPMGRGAKLSKVPELARFIREGEKGTSNETKALLEDDSRPRRIWWEPKRHIGLLSPDQEPTDRPRPALFIRRTSPEIVPDEELEDYAEDDDNTYADEEE